MVTEPRVVEFHEDRRAAVVEHMLTLTSRHKGWLNLTPGLDVDEPPAPPSLLTTVFGSRGPTIPLGTWTPSQGRDPATAGIQHGEGPRAAETLAEAGTPVPEGWRLRQDHPKRGLVVMMPEPTTAAELDAVLAWLLAATAALCSWPRTGEWRALVYG
jgi:hypothetical protein